MSIVEKLTFLGLDIPFTDKLITPDPSIKLGVRLNNLAGELRDNKILRRDLVVESTRWVTLFPISTEEGNGESLFDDEINGVDIEIQDKKWPFVRKIRYKGRRR